MEDWSLEDINFGYNFESSVTSLSLQLDNNASQRRLICPMYVSNISVIDG